MDNTIHGLFDEVHAKLVKGEILSLELDNNRFPILQPAEERYEAVPNGSAIFFDWDNAKLCIARNVSSGERVFVAALSHSSYDGTAYCAWTEDGEQVWAAA